MTPEQLRNAAAVMLAAAEGKPLESRPYGTKEWSTVTTPAWNWNSVEYRIKPEPREWWLVNSVAFGVLEDAICYQAQRTPNTEIIHVREVLP
jgi:hypothetical protein